MGVTFFLYKNKYLSINNPTQNEKNEAESLFKKVGKLIVLPTDELPTIATVTEPEKLKGQSFFEKAKKGDKVLIFTNAKIAILYDPVINKIITLAPLNIDDNKTKTSENKNITNQDEGDIILINDDPITESQF